jgi:hypothetical protein
MPYFFLSPDGRIEGDLMAPQATTVAPLGAAREGEKWCK